MSDVAILLLLMPLLPQLYHADSAMMAFMARALTQRSSYHLLTPSMLRRAERARGLRFFAPAGAAYGAARATR